MEEKEKLINVRLEFLNSINKIAEIKKPVAMAYVAVSADGIHGNMGYYDNGKTRELVYALARQICTIMEKHPKKEERNEDD